ncbi:hypothetical protein BTVI_24842 [Pitangus sulphuratus]|nr:hypothetical protein BTVI_24842 [Pitangus sulphuratus]
MEVGQSLAKSLDDASLTEGKKKDLQSEKVHISQKDIGRNNLSKQSANSQKIRRRLVTATMDLPRRNHSKAIELPVVTEAQTLSTGKKSQLPYVLSKAVDTILYNILEASKGNG